MEQTIGLKDDITNMIRVGQAKHNMYLKWKFHKFCGSFLEYIDRKDKI